MNELIWRAVVGLVMHSMNTPTSSLPPRKTDGEVEQMPIAPQNHKKRGRLIF